jgi:hypothetical protein
MHGIKVEGVFHETFPPGQKNQLTLIFPGVILRADEFIRQRLSGNQRSHR